MFVIVGVEEERRKEREGEEERKKERSLGG